MFDWSINFTAGKSTGIVTTSRITHATPAAAYAKVPHRYWESDVDQRKYNGSGCGQDIAQQLIYKNNNIDVRPVQTVMPQEPLVSVLH